jgi:uncharacterized protein
MVEDAVGYMAKYRRPDREAKHTFQTNGVLLDDAWCASQPRLAGC